MYSFLVNCLLQAIQRSHRRRTEEEQNREERWCYGELVEDSWPLPEGPEEEEEEEEEEGEKEAEEEGNHDSCHSPSSSSSSLLLLNLWESSASWRVSAAMAMEESCDVETTLSELGEREIFHMPSSDYSQRYEKKILDPCSRQEAVDWLFKVPSLSS